MATAGKPEIKPGDTVGSTNLHLLSNKPPKGKNPRKTAKANKSFGKGKKGK